MRRATMMLRRILAHCECVSRTTSVFSYRACGHAASYLDTATRRWSSCATSYDTIVVDKDDKVGIITINREKQLNALNSQVMRELVSAAHQFDADPSVKVLVVTGKGNKAFAAGADIKEMAEKTYSQAFNSSMLGGWEGLKAVRKPLIAAVNGYALGGGCEVAMLCDIIIASDKASFGQPEIQLGVIPGMGGTQRLTWAVGKYRAMDMMLTGSRISAADAERFGLVSRVVPHDKLMEETLLIARKVASFSLPALIKAKDCVNMALELPLPQGVQYEKREFWGAFALADQKEGMGAFVDKREAHFRDE